MNKRLIIIFVCLCVIVLTVILGAVVFTIKDIQVLTAGDEAESFDKAKIMSDSGIELNSSIFALSASTATANIEKANPYVKVINIERKFPSKVVINIAYRVGLIAIPLNGTNTYALIDRECKVVDIIDSITATSGKYTVVDGFNITGVTADDLLAMTMQKEGAIGSIASSVTGLEMLGFVNSNIPLFIKRIDFSVNNFAVLVTGYGMRFALRTNSNLSLEEQLHSIYSYFDSSDLSDADRRSSKYLVVTNTEIRMTDTLVGL